MSNEVHLTESDQIPDTSELEKLLEAAGCCRVTLQADGIIDSIDSSIQRIAGHAAEEVQGKPFLDLVPTEWKSRVQDWQQNTGQSHTFEFPIRTLRIGHYVWIRYTSIPKDEGSAAFMQDITASKKNERILTERTNRLRTIIDNIPIAIHAKNTEGEYILSNPAHYHLLGQLSEADILGKTSADFMPASMAARFEKEDYDVMHNGKTIVNEERTGLPNSKIKYLNANKVALKNNAGEVTGVVGIAQDITRQKLQEIELKRREEFYRTLARNLPQSAVFLYDRDLTILAAEGLSLASVQLTGQTLGSHIFEDVLSTSPIEGDELVRVYGEALNGNETRMERNYGNIYYRIHVLPVRNESGSIIAGLALVQNIDENKKSEQALRASEERNRALINAMPDLMFVAKRDGSISDFRPSLTNDVSLNVATDTQTIRQVGLPDAIIDESLHYLELALETGEIQSFEYTQNDMDSVFQRGRDDLMRSFEVRMTSLNDEEVLTMVRDISPLKRIQDEMSRHISDLKVVRQVSTELSDNLSFEYVVQLALDAAMRLSNAQTGFMAIKHEDSLNLLGTIGQYDEKQVNDMMNSNKGIVARVMRTLQPELVHNASADPDYVALRPDTTALMVVPLISHERPVGLLHLETRRAERFNEDRFQFLQLITGRIAAFLDNANLYRQTQEQLDELQKLYQAVAHLEQLKTDMIRIASHDLKNPLNWLTFYLQKLEEETQDILTDKQKTYIERIGNASDKMESITRSILSLEKIEQMAKEQKHQEVNLRDKLRRAIGEQMDFAVRKQHSMTHDLPDEPVYVLGDEMLLYEAMTNLISNAVKYTADAGQIHVSLGVAGGKAMIRVQDNGYGIPEERQERLFAPFYRVETEETKDIEGTGLGLHLVKNIIERHDGEMYVESVYGKGSTFGFDLPLLRGGAGAGAVPVK